MPAKHNRPSVGTLFRHFLQGGKGVFPGHVDVEDYERRSIAEYRLNQCASVGELAPPYELTTPAEFDGKRVGDCVIVIDT